MTHFFQPLDLTVNREAKTFMKEQFTSWDAGQRLSILKPIQETWLVSLYNYLASSEGRHSIAKGWKKAGETDVVSGSKKLPPENPFETWMLKNIADSRKICI